MRSVVFSAPEMPISPKLLEESCSPTVALFLPLRCFSAQFIFCLLLVQNQTWNLSDANCANEITLQWALQGRTYILPCCYGYLQPVPESERLHHQQWVGKAQLQPQLPPESNGTAKSGKRRRTEKKRWEVFLGKSCLWLPPPRRGTSCAETTFLHLQQDSGIFCL